MAVEARRRFGNPSDKDYLKLFKNNGIKNCPFDERDVKRAIEIYGPNLAMLKGATVRKASEVVRIENVEKANNKQVTVCLDIMFVSGLMLLSISRRLNLLMVRYVDSRNTASMKTGMAAIIAAYQSEGYTLQTWLYDGESALGALTNWLKSQGMSVNPTSKMFQRWKGR